MAENVFAGIRCSTAVRSCSAQRSGCSRSSFEKSLTPIRIARFAAKQETANTSSEATRNIIVQAASSWLNSQHCTRLGALSRNRNYHGIVPCGQRRWHDDVELIQA